jgi:hypothetical protein
MRCTAILILAGTLFAQVTPMATCVIRLGNFDYDRWTSAALAVRHAPAVKTGPLGAAIIEELGF